MAVTVVSWNLEGRAGLDVVAAAGVLEGLGADVACLQEVQHAQAGALRRALGWPPGRWSFKHWPVRRPPEGHALLARTKVHAAAHVLSQRQPPWAWQRRIAQVGRAEGVPGVVLVNTHLASGGGAAGAARGAQVRRITTRVSADVVCGDLNEPAGAAIDELHAAGLRDAWGAAAGAATPCLTNWSHADRAQPPDQRLDWIFVSERVEVVAARLGDWRTTAPLSDHVPLAVTLQRRAST